MDLEKYESYLLPNTMVEVTNRSICRRVLDPTPEAEASEMLVATVNSWREPMSPAAGRRLVSEKEWDLLQKEVGLLAVISDELLTYTTLFVRART